METKEKMRDVAIIGVGHTKFGVLKEKNILDLACESSLQAIENSGCSNKKFDAVYVGNMCAESLNHFTGLASALVDRINLIPAAADQIKNGPASGGSAIKAGFQAIKAGTCDLVLVTGVEKMTHVKERGRVTSTVATITHHAGERLHGVSLPAMAGMLTRYYLHEYNATMKYLDDIAIKNHRNGVHNPNAHFQREISEFMKRAEQKGKGSWSDEYEFLHDDKVNPIIADPLRLFHVCPVSDGAASVILCEGTLAKKMTDKPIYIRGVGQATDTHLVTERKTLRELEAVRWACNQAYKMAGKSSKDIDVGELHDAFEILEIMQSEAAGFFPLGEGGKAAEAGKTTIDGEIPINPSGGLKARGHPLGATGVAQVVELYWQLREEAGKRQVSNPKVGITVNFGGFGNNIVSIIVERGF
ncbi:MAG: thiolase C-terminal domain-containing protein [Candidatus Helarchaeota archaeon]